MDHHCECGEELIVHVRKDDLATYCPSCGIDGTLPKPKGISSKKEASNLVSITRASLLKKMNDVRTEIAKKPKQLRDRSDYTKARRAR